jgi:rare lipoprotein A
MRRLFRFVRLCLFVYCAAAPLQTGEVSYYHYTYKKRLASGEYYTTRERTAAHRTLPFDTILEVKRLDTGLTTTVRINDRGPYVRGRILDLNLTAARALKLRRHGVVKCELKELRHGKNR